ncbi:MAG: hypothetical protein H7A23_13610 [Leptospiraceae bacterium]|nr:hypothetical protein [Leptospiraceae bacterium]MCP5495587.1 hypothetical protein [Leptospiraceae bacterium]
MFIESLKNIRLWSFLIGIISVVVVSLYNNSQTDLKPDGYILPFLVILLIEILVNLIILMYIPIKKKNYISSLNPITEIFFYSGLTIFLYHCSLYYGTINVNIDYFFIGFVSALLIFDVLRLNGFLKNQTRYKFLILRLVLFIDIVLTIHFNNLEKYSYILVFFDALLMMLSLPEKIKFFKVIISLLIAFILLFITYVLHDHSKQKEIFYTCLVFLSIFFWFQYLLRRQIRYLNKIVLVTLSSFIFFFYFTPIPKNIHYSYTSQKEINPIPFMFTGIEFDKEEFIYYNTSLPFVNNETFPKRSEFKNKILVMELTYNPEPILIYINRLNIYRYPYIIFQHISLPAIKSIQDIEIIEYPLFRLYYPKNNLDRKKIKIKSFPSNNQIDIYIYSQISRLKNNIDIAKTLNEIYNTSYSVEIQNSVSLYKNVFYKSYKVYANYYYLNEDYFNTIFVANICFKYHILEKELLDVTYNSILKITPEEIHIPVMEILANYSAYKEQVLKRLYPLLMIKGKSELALGRIDELINLYGANSELSEIANLKAEKVRIYLQNSQIFQAEDIISKEILANPDSILWNKLKDDLQYRKNAIIDKNQYIKIYPQNSAVEEENGEEESNSETSE